MCASLDMINVSAYAKLGRMPSHCSQDIELKKNDNNQGPLQCCILLKETRTIPI